MRIAGLLGTLVAVPAIVGLLGDEPSPARATIVLLAVVVFYGFFFKGVRGRMAPQPPGLVAACYAADLAIAAALTIADRPDWNLLFYYVVALGGLRFARPWNFVAVLATAAAAVAATAIGGGASASKAAIGLGLLGIGAAMTAMGELMRANRDLHEARAEVARLAVADERVRFARDLHDLLGQSLSVIAIKSELARRRLPDDPEAAAAEVADIEKVTREALREVREAVSGYRRPILDSELAGARTALDAAGISTSIERPEDELPPEVEAVLAWTVREAATNVIRHSGARHSAIRVAKAPHEASVEVIDDGVGVNGGGASGSGLIGLEERVRAAGGRLEAGPREHGSGFRVRAVVPVASAE